MKKVISLLAAAMLAGCATTASTPSMATQQMQVGWYVTCQGWQSIQPTITAKISTASVSQIKAILPIAQSISAQCTAPMPSNPQQATVQLTASITKVLVTLGIQQAIK